VRNSKSRGEADVKNLFRLAHSLSEPASSRNGERGKPGSETVQGGVTIVRQRVEAVLFIASLPRLRRRLQ
jgi:hypothetical protein